MLKVISGLILIAIVVIGGWYFFFSGNGNGENDAVITFQGPEKVYPGVPFELIVGVSNNSPNLWREVKLSVFFNKSLISKNLGNLGEGSLTSVPLELVSTTESENEAELVLSYLPEGVDSRFEKRERWSLPPTEAAIKLDVTASEKIVSGEEVELKVDYKNVSDGDLEDLFLKVDYPAGFKFSKASQDPSSSENFWELGGLRQGSTGTLSIFGNLASADKEAEFKVLVLRDVNRNKVSISEEMVKLVIEESPLIVGIVLNETENFIAKPGDMLHYAIGYSKKSKVKAETAVIKARLLGEMFDLATLTINDSGSIRAGSNEIIWRQKIEEDGGAVTFSVRAKNEYSIRRLGDRDFTLKIKAEAAVGKLSNQTELETKLAGQVKIEVKGLFYDADSGIVNRAGQYTIHWLITNYATDIKDVVVRAPLPVGVIFTDAAKSNIDAKPIFDAVSQSVVWKVTRISAATGVVGRPVEGIFQVQSIQGSQQLLGETIITALDDFTGVTLIASAPAINSSQAAQQPLSY